MKNLFNPRPLICAVAVFCTLLTTHSYAQQPIAFKADYKAQIKGFSVKATRELKQVGQDQFELSFKASSWAAKINETSVFSWQDQQVQPQQYDYRQSAFGKKKARSIAFDQQKQQITTLQDDQTNTLPLTEAVFDQLNYQLQLQMDVAADKKDLTYSIVRKGGLRQYRFEILGDEILETQAGELNTVKVKVIRENKDKVTYIWFAKDWDYLLVQLEQYEGEKKRLAIALKKATVNEQTLSGL